MTFDSHFSMSAPCLWRLKTEQNVAPPRACAVRWQNLLLLEIFPSLGLNPESRLDLRMRNLLMKVIFMVCKKSIVSRSSLVITRWPMFHDINTCWTHRLDKPTPHAISPIITCSYWAPSPPTPESSYWSQVTYGNIWDICTLKTDLTVTFSIATGHSKLSIHYSKLGFPPDDDFPRRASNHACYISTGWQQHRTCTEIG